MPEAKPIKIWTRQLDASQIDRLQQTLLSLGDAEPFAVAYARFAYKLRERKANVTAYTSGKVVINGAGTQDFVIDIVEPQILGRAEIGYESVNHPDWFELHAGLDESGKGDFFGPLCTACVIAGGNAVRTWLDAGVRDSKKIADSQILKLDSLIRNTPGATVKVCKAATMERYNELYQAYGSLNTMLAASHFKSLQAACEAAPEKPARGLLDQFSTEPLVQSLIRQKKLPIDLQMRTHAEEDPVVAAASICARAAYAKAVAALEAQCGFSLPKGCGNEVLTAGTQILRQYGKDALRHYCKTHFKTLKQIF
ncbi:MAG: ribonuclease HIII [Opitutales bacterium]|nr:ribonuclease HIII [Opitutales bacterium]